MNDIDLLRAEIETMDAVIASQETACDVAKNVLAHREAAFSVAKSLAASNGLALSAAQWERYRLDILEGHDALHSKLVALGEMRKERRDLERRLQLAENKFQ